MKLDVKFYRVRLIADVLDEVNGEVYMDSDCCEIDMNDCTVDEALPTLIADYVNYVGSSTDIQLYVLRKCQEALMNHMNEQNYKVKIYQECIDNCIQMCADVILCALI